MRINLDFDGNAEEEEENDSNALLLLPSMKERKLLDHLDLFPIQVVPKIALKRKKPSATSIRTDRTEMKVAKI